MKYRYACMAPLWVAGCCITPRLRAGDNDKSKLWAVAAQIARLGYYGRQLQEDARDGDLPKSRSTAAEINRTWEQIRAVVYEHGAKEQAERVDRIVAGIQSATTPSELGTLAEQEQDEMENLEAAVFGQ